MKDLQVTYIKTLDLPHRHAGIIELGGQGWHKLRKEVIDAINAGTHTFYTFVDGKRADVCVRRSGIPYHPDYVQSKADGERTYNLLALPRVELSNEEVNLAAK